MTDLIRWRPPFIPAGCEWWTDNPHRLSARLRTEERRGRVALVDRVELAPGLHGAMVRRLKPRPPAGRRRALAATAVTVVLATGVYAVYAVAQLVAWLVDHAAVIAGCLLLAGAALFLRPNHRPTCAGLHCSGCKG
jgi:hypothetical protein